MFFASLYFYLHLNYQWYWFIIFLLVVDIFMIGYLSKDNKLGAYIYNIGHSLIIPLFLLVLGVVVSNKLSIGVSLIWIAHIGMDRSLGYGLKLESGFQYTHLGKIGKK